MPAGYRRAMALAPPPDPPADPMDGGLDGRARLGLAATLIAVSMAGLDSALVNTALPTIARSLGASPAASVWVVNAYQLAMVATLLPFAAVGDWLGPRRVCLAGLVAYALASLAAARADSLTALATARALQGVGAGALMSVNIALVRLIYPPRRLGQGVGINALMVGLSFTLGPTVAAAVLAVASWPWLFLVNLPLALVALACGWPGLPRTPRGHGVDALTALLTAVTCAGAIGALASTAQRLGAGLVAALLGAAALAGAALLRRQAGHPAPMLPVDLLRRPLFALSVATALAAFGAQGLAFVGLPFYFHDVLGRDAVATGLLMTPWALVVAAAAPVAGRLSDRIAPGLLGGVGLAVLSAGLLALAALPATAGDALVAAGMAVCGLGFGLFQAPNLKALMAAAPPQRAGGASGMVALARLTGQTSGAAAAALCFGLAGTRGPGWALALGAACAAAGALASAARLRWRA